MWILRITLRVTHNLHIVTAITFSNNSRFHETESPFSTKFGEEPDFLRKVRKRNPGKGIIIVLDNYSSHKAEEVVKEAQRLAVQLVFFPPYSADLNPVEYIGKSIKAIISTAFIRHIDDMRNLIMESFYRFSQKTFAALIRESRFKRLTWRVTTEANLASFDFSFSFTD